MSECSIFNTFENIGQGTIIKFLDKPDSEYLYGIIVTADCDIAQNKCGNYLSFCYITSLKKYIKNTLIPRLCKKTITKNFIKIAKNIRKTKDYEKVSDNSIEHLLSFTKNELTKRFSKDLVDQICCFQSFYQKEEFTFIDYKSICKANEKELMENVKNFPGDKFYINEIPDESLTQKGFVVNLRRIAEIEVSNITTRIYPFSKPNCIAIAKLNSPYKEKMAQTLGEMFSSIGLSTEYEDFRDKNIETAIGEILI